MARRSSWVGWALVGVVLSCGCIARRETPPTGSTAARTPANTSAGRAMYQNPVVPGFYPDPSVCRVGSDYYLVTSTFEYFPGVPIFHSRDLVHWRQIGHALSRRSQLELGATKSSKGIFAPTLRHHAGTFYLVTTNIEGGGNFYVTTTDPAKEWSEPVWIREQSWGMDPSLFFDDDGKVYYTRHGGGERGGVYQAEIDLRSGALVEEPRRIWSGTGGVWPEGPHLYKFHGTYYLMIAEGGTSYHHAITIARSKTPWGPFEPCPNNPILTHRDRAGHPIQATGHGDLVQAENGSTWMTFLAVRPAEAGRHHLGRETFLAPVSWDAEGWPIVNQNRGVELEMDASGLTLGPHGAEPPLREDFDAAKLGLDWTFVRNPDPAALSLSARPGRLRLLGTATSLDDVGAPAFAGKRQRHFDCVVSTSLDFTPVMAGEEAGLTLRANEDDHYELFVTREGPRTVVRARTRVKGVSRVVAEEAVTGSPIELEIRADRTRYRFFARAPGAAPRALGEAPTAPLSSELAGGFTGVVIGLYAVNRGSGAASPADFDWFEYRPLL